MNKSKLKTIMIIGSIALAAISVMICSYATYAIFTSNKTEGVTISTGTVQVKLEEDAPFTEGTQPENGYSTNKKTFRVVSEGSKRTYTRVAVFPSIEYYDSESGTWGVLGALSNNDLTYDITDSTLQNWTFDDGYYYYNEILSEGEKTSDFIIENIALGTVPVEYKDLTLRINMYVEAEGIQATHNSYEINWEGNLPENIETLPPYADDAELKNIPSHPEDEIADSSGHIIQ